LTIVPCTPSRCLTRDDAPTWHLGSDTFGSRRDVVGGERRDDDHETNGNTTPTNDDDAEQIFDSREKENLEREIKSDATTSGNR